MKNRIGYVLLFMIVLMGAFSFSCVHTYAQNVQTGITIDAVPSQVVRPGQATVYRTLITNNDPIPRTIVLDVTSENEWPVLADLSGTITLMAGEALPITITHSVPLSTGNGEHDLLWIAVEYTDDNETPYRNIRIVETVVEAYHGFELAVDPGAQLGHPGETLTYQLYISNTGTVQDNNLSVQVVDAAEMSFATRIIDPIGGNDDHVGHFVLPLSSNMIDLVVEIEVEIPADTVSGAVETVMLIITSDGLGQGVYQREVALTTLVDLPSPMPTLTPQPTPTMTPTPMVIGDASDITLTSASSQHVAPGETAQYAHLITNHTAVTRTIAIDLYSENGWDATADPVYLTLSPNEDRPITLTHLAPMTAGNGAQDQLQLAALSGDGIANAVIVSQTTTVDASYGILLDTPIQFDAGLPGKRLSHILTVKNNGTETDTVSLEVEQNENGVMQTAFIDPFTGDRVAKIDDIIFPAGIALFVELVIDIPVGATDGLVETAVINAISQEHIYQTETQITTLVGNDVPAVDNDINSPFAFENEPNDWFDTATVLTHGIIQAMMESAGTFDFYTIPVEAEKAYRLNVRLIDDVDNHGVYLIVYDAQRQRLREQAVYGQRDIVVSANEDAWYHVAVRTAGGTGSDEVQTSPYGYVMRVEEIDVADANLLSVQEWRMSAVSSDVATIYFILILLAGVTIITGRMANRSEFGRHSNSIP